MAGVKSGKKKGTIRKGRARIKKGPVVITDGRRKISAEVVGILEMRLRDLRQIHIDATGERSTPKRYAVALTRYYPGIKLDDTIHIVYFKVA